MDMYEFVHQVGRLLGNEQFINDAGDTLLSIQPIIDQGLLSDTMVFSGIVNSTLNAIPEV